MVYAYEILPRAAALGDGWRLRLLEDGDEVGGGVFPIPIVAADPEEGMAWWNGLVEPERARWLHVAGSAVPGDAWLAYLRDEAYGDALGEAEDWLSSRSGNDE